MAKLVVHRQAANYLKKLPKIQKEKVKTSLRRLEENPLEMCMPRNIARQKYIDSVKGL